MKMGIIVALLMFQLQQAAIPDLPQLRKLYISASTQKDDSQKLSDLLNGSDSTFTPVFLCYKGAATIIKAKYAVSPVKKLSLFKDGKLLIEQAISRDTNSIEMRYIRLTIQKNLPSFLHYNSNILTDKDFLQMKIANEQDVELKTMVINYLDGLK